MKYNKGAGGWENDGADERLKRGARRGEDRGDGRRLN